MNNENTKNKINMLDEMANFTFTTKYAKYDEKKKRRETWDETVGRVEKMHLKRYSSLSAEDKAEIIKAFDYVRAKKVTPSMRSMQFGGKAIEAHNGRIYNCGVRHVDSIRSFAESFYALLCGTGVGFGITNFFLNRIPDFVNKNDKTGTVVTYVIEDSIEGWADSIEALLNCYCKNTAYSGRKIVFDYSKIRPKGTKLKTGGGKAPGYKGLKNCHKKIKDLLDTVIEDQGQKRMKTINAYDILMHCADAVLSGGIRRSACSVIFEATDEDMMNAKTGNWFEKNPQRARSNNSAIIIRGKTSYKEFCDLIEKTKQFGEPGFLYVVDEKQLLNPCFEISFIPITADGRCGFQFCNLTSINGAKITSINEFKEASWAASLIGTLQAGYTTFPYLGHTTQELTREEALLGVSITGMMDNPDVLFNSKFQKEAAQVAVDTNKIWAKKIGINQAHRVTCIKPEGTNSIVLSAASGIHPHHATKYFRRIQVNKEDNVYRFFKMFNDHACEESVWSANKVDDVITFPVEVSEVAKIKENLSAIEHLKLIRLTQKNWVNTGTTEVNTKPLNHSVSCTVIVKDDEWTEVTKFLFDNQEDFTAVSLLPYSGDKIYKQAPMEAVVTPEDEARFDNLVKNWSKVDYKKLEEHDDETSHTTEAACAGGNCEVKAL
jgi:ribonucleoside-diphosphate reductase alpha chain